MTKGQLAMVAATGVPGSRDDEAARFLRGKGTVPDRMGFRIQRARPEV